MFDQLLEFAHLTMHLDIEMNAYDMVTNYSSPQHFYHKIPLPLHICAQLSIEEQ